MLLLFKRNYLTLQGGLLFLTEHTACEKSSVNGTALKTGAGVDMPMSRRPTPNLHKNT